MNSLLLSSLLNVLARGLPNLRSCVGSVVVAGFLSWDCFSFFSAFGVVFLFELSMDAFSAWRDSLVSDSLLSPFGCGVTSLCVYLLLAARNISSILLISASALGSISLDFLVAMVICAL